MAMQNKKTTIMGYFAILVAVGTLIQAFLSGEPIDLQSILLALGIGGAGAAGVSAQDGGP